MCAVMELCVKSGIFAKDKERNMKRAIIIGASSGIGLEVSRLLLADGWILGVAARRTENLLELQRLAANRVFVETIDVTKDDAAERLGTLIRKVGGMDLYFHASGIGKQNRDLQADIELQTVNTNGMGFVRMVGEAFRFMEQHGGGHIAVISSIAGTKGLSAAPSYSATKALQNTYIQALEQLANSRGLNIAFTDIRPGFVDTALLRDGNCYPMLLKPDEVACDIVRSINRRRHIRIIDFRWRIVTALWRRIPRWIWRRMRLQQT